MTLDRARFIFVAQLPLSYAWEQDPDVAQYLALCLFGRSGRSVQT
jgi:hypothetical protein